LVCIYYYSRYCKWSELFLTVCNFIRWLCFGVDFFMYLNC
jgi:hypothetical protein